MTEERQTDATAGANGTTGDAAVSSGAQTVEEVEAFWRNRWSGTDRAHNAETAALKAQIEALKAQPAPAPVGESPEAARIRALEAQLQQEQARAQAADLRAKYPLAASVLGDTITALPEEKIAAVNGMASGGNPAPGGSVIDPNNAGRRASAGQPGQAAKPLNEKSKEELLNDLRSATPQIMAEARGGF